MERQNKNKRPVLAEKALCELTVQARSPRQHQDRLRVAQSTSRRSPSTTDTWQMPVGTSWEEEPSAHEFPRS